MNPEPVQTNNQYSRAEADILAHIETKLADIDAGRELSRSRNSFFAGATFSLSSILRELRRGAARGASTRAPVRRIGKVAKVARA